MEEPLLSTNSYQTISLTGRERAYSIFNYEVVVHASPSASLNDSTSGSNQVQVTTIANQKWELPAHPGHMVASNTHYIAYSLKGGSAYVLRVIHRHSNNRALLKGFTGPVLDMGFVPGLSSLLACVDQGGNVFVWNLGKTENLSDAQSTLQLRSERSSTPDHTHHRLSWCPYLPHEEGEDDEDGWLLAVSHGCEVEVYHIEILLSAASGSSGPKVLTTETEVKGRLIISSPHTMPVLDMSLSPDGGVLATSSEDGHLKFWQINWNTSFQDNISVQEMLHDFSPHDGEPVTRLIFCDNHTAQDDEMAQYWRFLITGANGNREVKLWCTVTWKCLQTFHFLPPNDPASDAVDPNILLHLDITASYLIATDTSRMTLYIFQLVMDGIGGGGGASLISITEYLLTQPVLSFIIAGHTPCPTSNEAGEGGESGEEGEEEEKEEEEGGEKMKEVAGRGRGGGGERMDRRLMTVLIKLFAVHTRSMQELQVRFEPPDVMGSPPDPLPFPLYATESNFSREKALAASNPELPPPATNGDLAQETREEEEEEEEDVQEEEGEGEEVDGGNQVDVVGSQPNSLPSSFQPIITSTAVSSGEPFLSLPSLPGVSPKLVTPSAFLSAAKIDLSPSHKPSPSPSSSSISPSTKSPYHFTASNLPPLESSTLSSVSTTHTATLTSVTSSMMSSPGTLLGSTHTDKTPPTGTSVDWSPISASVEEEDVNKDDDEKERSIGRGKEEEKEGEEAGGEGGGGKDGEEEGEREEESDIDDLRMSQLVDSQEPPVEEEKMAAEEEEEEEEVKEEDEEEEEEEEEGGGVNNNSVQEKLHEIFGMSKELDTITTSSSGGDQTIMSQTLNEGVENLERPPGGGHLRRPQQMFTSTEKSEIVTISSKALTPTTEEGTEVVNAAGTPSAEYMEMFSNQNSRKGSKATTPRATDREGGGGGGNNEVEMGFGFPAAHWMDKVSDNAASAWPDLGSSELPKLVPRDDAEVTTNFPGSAHREELERNNNNEPETEGFNSTYGGTGEEASKVQTQEVKSYSEIFPSAILSSTTIRSESGTPLIPPGLEVTEGETGQSLLPATNSDPQLLFPPSLPPPSSQPHPAASHGGGDRVTGEGGEGDGGERMEETETVTENDNGIRTKSPLQEDLHARGRELEQQQRPVLVVRGGGESETVAPKAKSRRKKTKGKQQQAATTASDTELLFDGRIGVPYTNQKPTLPALTATNDPGSMGGVVDHTHHLTQLYQLVVAQQQELAALREEQSRSFASLCGQVEMVQRSMVEERQRLMETTREQQVKIERAMKEKQLVDRQKQDKLISTVSQTLSAAVNVKLDKVVKSEMKNNINPAVNKSLASLHDEVRTGIMSVTDQALRDGITSIIQSKGLPEAVGVAVAGAIRTNIQKMYEETFRSVVMPSFERSCQEMFRQVDEAFRRGISEYMTQLQQQFHQLSEPALQQLAVSYQSLTLPPDSPLLTALQRELKNTLQSMVQGESVRGVVREEVEAALQRHAHSINSQTQAKEDKARKQEEIQRLVQSQEINRAFEAALSTSDLELVVYLCQQVTAEDVFDKTPCPLSQPVLLSLIQQLSVNLSDNLDLKLRFLEASVMALDVTNDITKSHMTHILRTLTQQVTSAEQTQRNVPGSASLLRSMKRLRMVTERLCPPGH